jgi:glutamine amidotransferase PdxT
MQLFSQKSLNAQQREALVSLTAMYFIEEHALLSHDQIDEARESLQALFLRTSGEETMLRKLIEILKTTRALHQSFADIGIILTGVSKGLLTLNGKVSAMREQFGRTKFTAEENADFVDPFLSFSQEFLQRTETFHRLMHEYLETKEVESRQANIFRIAREARVRLKQRLSSDLGTDMRGAVETKIRQEVIASFDYSEAETNYKYTQRDSLNKEIEITEVLANIRAMAEMARNPTMREPEEETKDSDKPPRYHYDDIFTRAALALRKHPRLAQMKNSILELFRLYQHSFGMFSLDFNNLARAAETMIANTEAYFEAKEEDKDIRTKRDKLKKIEGVIPFLEQSANLLHDPELGDYTKFSKRISATISEKRQPWEHIFEELLRAKVQAEAELSTRM